MVTLSNNKKIQIVDAVFHITLALERWFPDNNGAFAYGTRLCEESGELMEAIGTLPKQPRAKDRHHLIKEVADVLQIALGVLNIYDLRAQLPKDFADFGFSSDPKDPQKYVLLIGVRAGEFANSINHAQGAGIKTQKHGNQTKERMVEKATKLAQVLAWVINYYGLHDQFNDQVAEDYHRLQERGLIPKL
ncbi:MAG TPA: MazG nucleotide pyrophosphohydrolase domain-containing protein [Candidatus Saccharimonadales bacterium]|nr:MazG nucleotide pyrophosphohydrolase domain-containing protein [Candidatus Saccharimonadales bacterium]